MGRGLPAGAGPRTARPVDRSGLGRRIGNFHQLLPEILAGKQPHERSWGMLEADGDVLPLHEFAFALPVLFIGLRGQVPCSLPQLSSSFQVLLVRARASTRRERMPPVGQSVLAGSNRDNDLADLPARFQIAVRVPDLIECKDPVDHRLQGAFV